MENQQKLKTRYEVATYAFDEISKRNAELALKGGYLTAEALQREEAAHQELAAARGRAFAPASVVARRADHPAR